AAAACSSGKVSTIGAIAKAAASDEARGTLRYVEPLSDARTPLADFINSPLIGIRECARAGSQIAISSFT
ncbi:MAG: hypothetical protein ACREJN_19610, partial [Nitrospiraceae bacterium]